MKRIVSILLISIIMLLVTTNPVMASGSPADLSWSGIAGAAKDFLEAGAAKPIDIQAGNLVSNLANILTTIGVTIVLIGILVMGIKYMVATPDEAAKLKTKLVGLVIAGIVIIGAWGIWNLAITFFSAMTK